MNIEIIGRHALLFDDDTTAAFVNSDDALVEWNSLLIDRYDVRHLLSSPPPSRRRRNPQTTCSSSADAEIDYERYLDLLSQPDEQEEDAEPEKPEPVGGFNAVPFSYGKYEDCNDQKTAEAESEISGFYPPFPVPDSLIQNVPPTEKVHQIIARTALFVSKNGGQSEIVLRVKQGDNPTFGFLMPDHHLHPYFRFLVDHQDLLPSKDDGQPKTEEKTSNTGALSLLGSVYGTGEDDDGGVEHTSSISKECVSGNTMDVDAASSLAAGKTMLPAGKDESVLKHLLPSKEETFTIKKNSLPNALKSGRSSSLRKGESSGLLSAVPDKSRASSLPPFPKTEHMLLVDPPSDMKRLVDKIVEFIIKNGRQFEAVLIEQDRGHGRFPFLLPSNIFHPYYLKILQKAQEPKLPVKGFQNEKEDFSGHMNKKTSISKVNGNSMVESDDIPLDSERKEKFKMVINKTKKEGSELPAKEPQQQLGVQVDAAQVAAILQAATRGITHPNLGTLFGKPFNEANSSDSHMTHEQKLKAERLKRAKMFVAQLKNGAAPSKAEPSRGLSAEPPQLQGSEADNHLEAKERERNPTPFDIDTLDKRVKSEKEQLEEDRRAKRKYRARGEPTETQEDEEDDVEGDEREERRSHRHHKKKHRSHNHSAEDESEEKYEDERDYKQAKRRHRSHHSSHKHDDIDQGNDEKDHKYLRKKHKSRHSSYDDSEQETEHEYSRKKHRSRYSSNDEVSDDEVDSDHKYSRKKRSHNSSRHRSHRSSHHSRDRHKYRKSEYSSHRQKLNASAEDKSRDYDKVDKHVKGSNSEREELEEGEISSKSGQSIGGPLVNREPLVDVSSSLQDQRPPRQPSETTTEVPDDLRAKIRAMLMSTM